LTISPASGPAVMWALARNFDFPQEVSRKALAAACDGKTATLDQVQALLSLLTINRDFRNAAELLDRHIALYERSGICDAWCFVRAQMWMAQGDPAKAEAVLAQAKDPEIRARTRVALVRFTAQSQCWTPELAAVLDTEFRRSGSDESLFGACEAHYFAERFDYVADRAEELVRRIGTESTLRLALDATALAKRYELCLELGTHHRTLFRDGTLPQTRLSEANISPSPAARASRVKASSVPRQVTTKHSSQNSNSANDSICPASEASSDWFSTARFPRSGSAIVNHIFGLLNTSYNFSDTSVFTEW